MTETLLSIQEVQVTFSRGKSVLHAVNGASLDVYPGETLGVVGESGSGKSVTLMSALGLLPSPPARVTRGRALFQGVDLLALSDSELRALRGREIGFIFQEPLTSLNPTMRVGDQIAECIVVHQKKRNWKEARRRAVELLEIVGISDPARRARQFPHEFSGGMLQRVVVAMAISNDPKLLIADEPTTALDVTIQAQVLDVMRDAQERTKAATILVSHDLGVIAQMASRVVVMYAGRVVEEAAASILFSEPLHPYTKGLLKSSPTIRSEVEDLVPIEGQPPSLTKAVEGCAFYSRCPFGQGRCLSETPEYRAMGNGRKVACHFAEDIQEAVIQGAQS